MSDDSEVLTSTQVAERAPRDWREVEGMLRTRLKVKDYAAAVDLVNRIAKAADEADHHPDIDIPDWRSCPRLWQHRRGARSGSICRVYFQDCSQA